MRILILTNTYPPADITGVGALVFELAGELTGHGHRVKVLTRGAAADDPHAVATGGPKLLFPLLAGWRYLRLALASPFDLVHLHESDGVVVALLLRLARLLGQRSGSTRLVATLQVSYVRERRSVRPVHADGRVVSRPTVGERIFAWLRAPLLAALGRLTARLSDAVVAPSRVTAGELEEDYGTRVVAVIPNGVAVGDDSPRRCRRDAGAPSEDAPSEDAPSGDVPTFPVVLYAGRLRTRKAVAVLLEAFARVHERVPGASLVVAGDGEHRAALEERAQSLAVEGAVRFLGTIPRDEMSRWYAAADVFCLPSIYEGFPLAILEAMAAGLPVVSTTVSGIPEAVDDGRTGLLVAPEDAAALAAALERLADDPELCREMGENGRRMLRERFSIETVSAAYLDLWESLGMETSGKETG